jgi:hypothetical protein
MRSMRVLALAFAVIVLSCVSSEAGGYRRYRGFVPAPGSTRYTDYYDYTSGYGYRARESYYSPWGSASYSYSAYSPYFPVYAPVYVPVYTPPVYGYAYWYTY